MLEKLDTIRLDLENLNADLSMSAIDSKVSDEDTQWIESSLNSIISRAEDIRSTLRTIREKNKKEEKKKDLASNIAHSMTTWTENCGGVTGTEWKEFCRDFKKMIKQELKKVDAVLENIDFNHYCLSGFFKLKEQFYYFSMSDIRNTDSSTLLIRTAAHVKDYYGGQNTFVNVEPDMFVHYFSKTLIGV